MIEILGGIILILTGSYITIAQVKKTSTGKDDELGFSYKGLGGGLIFLIAGLALIFKHL